MKKALVGKPAGAFYMGIAISLMPSGFGLVSLCKMALFAAYAAASYDRSSVRETNET